MNDKEKGIIGLRLDCFRMFKGAKLASSTSPNEEEIDEMFTKTSSYSALTALKELKKKGEFSAYDLAMILVAKITKLNSQHLETLMLEKDEQAGKHLLAHLIESLDTPSRIERNRVQKALVLTVVCGNSKKCKRTLLNELKNILCEIGCENRKHPGTKELLELLNELVSQPEAVVSKEEREPEWIVKFCLLPLHSKICFSTELVTLTKVLVVCSKNDTEALLFSVCKIVKVVKHAIGMDKAEVILEIGALLDAANTRVDVISIVKFILPLLKVECNSPHFLIAERILSLIRSQRVLYGITKLGTNEMYNGLIQKVIQASLLHWELRVRASALTTLQILRELDGKAFGKELHLVNIKQS